jgi:L-asparaginase / beta-aspartyl-peptidase
MKPRNLICLLPLAALVTGCATGFQKETAASKADEPRYVLAIHGGSGANPDMSPELLREYREALAEALRAGYARLQAGGSSLDAVEAAVVVLEDSPLFNAGRGAVFTHEGRNELDASIMFGQGLDAGAVAGVTTVKNPIRAARAVMEQSPHVLMAGPGAEKFAQASGVEIVEPEYFWTQRRWDALQRAIEREQTNDTSSLPSEIQESRSGTVGAVALDRHGNLAAATSTGGMVNKRHGRIGDSPIIGAGTYADNRTVAVSCTGWGEKFIRTAVAHNISALIAYRGLSVGEAASRALADVEEIGGHGGLIALDRHGHLAMPFTTRGMYRGAVRSDGRIEVFIQHEEPWSPE